MVLEVKLLLNITFRILDTDSHYLASATHLFYFQSISRCVPGIGIYFSSIHFLKGKFEHSKSPIESMLIGGSARSVAVVTMLPFTVLKTRYEVSVLHVMFDIPFITFIEYMY